MRFLKLIHVIFGAILAIIGMLPSCNDGNSVAKILAEMESKPLKLCMTNMLCLISGQDTIGYLPQDYKYLMIVNVDSSACTSCKISEVAQWNKWIELAENEKSDFAILFIFQPKSGEGFAIANKLRGYSKYFYKNTPFYCDEEGRFLKENFNHKIPPSMQTMLIDDSDRVVVVGNPIENQAIKEQVMDIINN